MYTTHQSKECMCSLLSDKLDEDAVHFFAQLVCVSGKRDKMIAELCTQVQNYNIVYAARLDSAEDFSRLDALLCTAMDWIFIPASCFALP